MKKENDILAELREWGSPLADMSRAMPFEVPVAYFESKIEEIPFYIEHVSSDIDHKEMPYQLPAGYFDALQQQMLDIVKAENFNEAMPRQTPFALPAGYFETFPAQVTALVKPKPAKRSIVFIPQSWIRYAAAAVLVVAIGLGAYQYTNHVPGSPEKQLAKVPTTSVQQYLHQNAPEAEIESNNIAGADNSIKIATQQLDKKDIEQYLDETGSNIN